MLAPISPTFGPREWYARSPDAICSNEPTRFAVRYLPEKVLSLLLWNATALRYSCSNSPLIFLGARQGICLRFNHVDPKQRTPCVFLSVCAFWFTLRRCVVCAPRWPASRCLPPTSLANGFQFRLFGLSRRTRDGRKGATNQVLLEHTTSDGRTFYILWIEHKISRSCPVNLEGLTSDGE
jgi:hypothetical protein